ncbi:MAG: GNAT family N-acetyltransferase [Gemmatimonadota bacterium]|nr:GNAT family N-acetyltransferase [Gemmatimonadota bacterium]
MPSIESIQYRKATSADVIAMAQCRLTDPAAGAADSRIAAYLEGTHHPQQALLPRVGYLALADDAVIGYIAGHRTRRFGCDGELQYLFVAPNHRKLGIATVLLRSLAGWFQEQGAARVCVNVDVDSPAAKPFYTVHGAVALNTYWYVWEDIGRLRFGAGAP